jgi:hypothetical protein
MKPVFAFLGGLTLLWALFLPAVATGDHYLRLDWRPPLILLLLLVLLALFALVRLAVPILLRWFLAALVLAAALLQAVEAVMERLMDRALDLYFDLAQVPSLLGLFRDAAGIWRAGAAVLAAVAVLAALLLAIAWSLAALERFCRRRAVAGSVLVGAGMVLGLFPVGTGAGLALAGQAVSGYHEWAAMHGHDRRAAAALAAPQPPLGPLPGLAGRDVYLIFVESYGTVVLDNPRFYAVVGPALAQFERVVSGAGYHLLSSRLVSPVFGGGSWLAHGTLASGVKLDQLLSRLLPESDRKVLPKYFAAAGYRTVDVMPGIKKPWPEGGFWGFDRAYYAKDLDYKGPQFGWFDIPDQYTLRRFADSELTPGHPSLFAQLVLVSSHTPFVPLPPYLADWADTDLYRGIPQAQWDRIYHDPDWSDLDRPYLDSIVYDLQVLGAWLARRDDHALVIVLGDHQPPLPGAGGKADWTVPIHVLSRDADLVQPFAELGYVAGVTPPRQEKPAGMEGFLAAFLAAYAGE